MPLSAGAKLGPYEILAPLGSGGMGEVYRARDGRLAREVALKVLPAEVATDPIRHARFEQEARAIAALNHPNIMAIYDVGMHEGMFYVVSELLEGETLHDLLEDTALPPRKSIEYATQAARGLAAAHAKRIIHRDLKPDNLFITHSGQLKILDFGLAKLTAPRAAADSTSIPTMSMSTEPGMVMGTAGYMSPEQVRGQEVDSRSDIFSLGAVFYEMLTGKRAFQGDSAVETMNAILKDDPAELPASMPPAIDRIVRRCLEKRPGERFQSALDLAFALESLSGTSDRKTAPEQSIAGRSRFLRNALIAAVAIAIFIAGELVHALLTRPEKPAAYSGLLLAGPEDGLCPRISPDGHLLAFSAVIGEDSQVAVMKPESGNYTVLTHDRTRGPISDLSWSPDGNEIYYDRQTDLPHGIFRVPALGGDERIVLEDALAPEVLPDRSMLLSRMNQSGQLQLTRYWPETGKFREFDFEVLQSAVSGSIVLRPFPDGKEAVALGLPLGKGRELGPRPWIIDINTGAMRSVVPPEEHGPFSAIAVTHNGQSVLVSISAGSLYQVLAYPRNGRASKRILFSVMSSPVTMDSGPDGSVYIDQVARPITIARFPESGGHIERLADLGEQTPQLPALAALPDGRLVVQQVTAGRTRLLVIDPGKSPAQFLQTNESTEGPIAPTANGDIAFLIGPNRGNAIAIASVASGRLLQRIPFTEGPVDSLAATPDGKTIYCASSGSIWAITPADGRVTKLREGSGLALDVARNSLIIESRRGQSFRLLRYAIQGGATTEIPMKGPVRIGAIKISGLVGPKDMLLAPGTLPDSWFQPPITIDLATGAMKRVHEDLPADYLALAWTADGRIAAVAYELRATLWRFQPQQP